MEEEFLAVSMHWLFFFQTVMKIDGFHVGHLEFLQ
jgi:hypothetical protein